MPDWAIVFFIAVLVLAVFLVMRAVVRKGDPSQEGRRDLSTGVDARLVAIEERLDRIEGSLGSLRSGESSS